jgi:hypothetical protein
MVVVSTDSFFGIDGMDENVFFFWGLSSLKVSTTQTRTSRVSLSLLKPQKKKTFSSIPSIPKKESVETTTMDGTTQMEI